MKKPEGKSVLVIVVVVVVGNIFTYFAALASSWRKEQATTLDGPTEEARRRAWPLKLTRGRGTTACTAPTNTQEVAGPCHRRFLHVSADRGEAFVMYCPASTGPGSDWRPAEPSRKPIVLPL